MYVDYYQYILFLNFHIDDMKLEAAKAEFGRRRIAQEAKKLALAALLCRLAVGSSNGEQFDQQLKKTIKNQKNKNQESLPVISGEITEPEGKSENTKNEIFIQIIYCSSRTANSNQIGNRWHGYGSMGS